MAWMTKSYEKDVSTLLYLFWLQHDFTSFPKCTLCANSGNVINVLVYELNFGPEKQQKLSLSIVYNTIGLGWKWSSTVHKTTPGCGFSRPAVKGFRDTHKVDEWIQNPHTNLLINNIYLICKTFMDKLINMCLYQLLLIIKSEILNNSK